MSKSEPKPPALSPDEIIQEEALRAARGIQKPGQTKEQTKLIAQGIAKGIEMYKKQQSAKARERDRQRKRTLKLKQAGAATDPDAGGEDAEGYTDSAETGGAATALMAAGAVLAAMALAHLARALTGWELILGPWTVPGWTSLAVALALAVLSCWLFLTAANSR
jgi:hypothetical protein